MRNFHPFSLNFGFRISDFEFSTRIPRENAEGGWAAFLIPHSTLR